FLTRRCHLTSLFVGAELSARRCYTLGKTLAQPLDDPVIDPTGGEPDGVGDRATRGPSVRNDGQPAQPEQVGAAVGVGIETRAQTACRGADQKRAELASGGRADLLTELVQ